MPPRDEISQWHGAHLAHSEGVLLAGRHPLELDEVVVGAVRRHQRARVLKGRPKHEDRRNFLIYESFRELEVCEPGFICFRPPY